MSKRRLIRAAAFVLPFALAGCPRPEPKIQQGQPVPRTFGNVVNLAQGWTEEQQERYWFTSQGSRILPMKWFLALEQASGSDLFRSDAHLDQLGFLLEKPSPKNPDGLPVGFAGDMDTSGEVWMGWTCAACHTNQIHYQETAMRVDGAPALIDVWSFLSELNAALQKTADDDEKFDRFAGKVLGTGHDPRQAEVLRQDLRKRAAFLAGWLRGNQSPYPYGYGRIDAFGFIFNQALGTYLGLPGNMQPADAPVSFPFLWDAPYADQVQWNGSFANAEPAGPLPRNIGEVLGVFAHLSVDPSQGDHGYESSVNIENLGKIEESLTKLESPVWPSKVLPAIDPRRAEEGKEIYRAECASCHTLIDRTSPHREFKVTMTLISEVKTDPAMARNYLLRCGRTGRLEGVKVHILAGSKFGASAFAKDVLINQVLGIMLRQKGPTSDAMVEDFVNVGFPQHFALMSYKARPLNGIWATAPYLHNGSVPNLWELLLPEDQRSRSFQVGSRDYDPVHVGFQTQGSPGGFAFDTTLPGNSNAGHTFGTQLTDDQKWALIEYLKSL